MKSDSLEMRFGTMGYIHCDKGILMLSKFKRKDDPNSGYHTLPGGKLELDEMGIYDPLGRESSVKREVEKETGIFMLYPRFMGTILFYNKDRTFDNWSEKRKKNFFVYMYHSGHPKGELKESDEGIPYWAQSWEEIESRPSNPGDKLMYKWVKEWKRMYDYLGKKNSFIGVIKHNGKEIDREGSWVDWL